MPLSQLPQQRIDEAVLLRLLAWILATVVCVIPERSIAGEANDIHSDQTVVDEVDEIDQDVASSKGLSPTSAFAPGNVRNNEDHLTALHLVMEVGMSWIFTS